MGIFVLPSVLRNAPGSRAAQLLIDGLGVVCYNKKDSTDRFWEVAYPRKEHHTLAITIYRLNGNDVLIETLVREKEVDERVRTFSIRVSPGSTAHHTEFPDGGPKTKPFDRDVPATPHDLSWMIDLADAEGKLGHGPVLLLPSNESRKISFARIRHSLFCTLEPEDEPVMISPRDRDDPFASGTVVFGRTNTELVGVLLGDIEGQIHFDDPDGLINIGPLDYGPNQRYQIEIINEDNREHEKKKGFVRGDLRLFYDHVIKVGKGREKDLWARPARKGTRVAPDGDCHLPDFSGESLDELLQQEAPQFANRSSNAVATKSTKVTSKKAAKKSATGTSKRIAKRKPTKARSKRSAVRKRSSRT